MNAVLKEYSKGSYRFFSKYTLADTDLVKLTGLFQGADRSDPIPALGGRCSVSRMGLQEIGPVVVKHYRRGGVLACFVRRTYLAVGKTRCQAEFEQLENARRLGISVPEPIAFAVKGTLFYQAWLVTREIAHATSLAQISRISPERAAASMSPLCREVSKLVEHKILHADFHPGNVLINENNTVFIIDFDRSKHFTKSKDRLKARYRRRWCKAIQKHELSEMLCERLIL
jgi:serine/threonine protein kinase